MDEQSRVTLSRLLPEVADVIGPLVDEYAYLVKTCDQWDLHPDGSAVRTWTADFTPDDPGPTIRNLVRVANARVEKTYRRIDREEALGRTTFEKKGSCVRVWPATTIHGQGGEAESLRIDVKRASPGGCPVPFSEVFGRFRSDLGGAVITSAAREHSMCLDALEQIGAVIERAVIGDLDLAFCGNLFARGYDGDTERGFRRDVSDQTFAAFARVEAAEGVGRGVSLTVSLVRR